jgi:hypothetical protein
MMTDNEFLAALRAAHGRITAAAIDQGRDAILDAHRAAQAAEAWQLDRSLDLPAPDGTQPAPWATVSGPLTVAEATALLRAMTRPQ